MDDRPCDGSPARDWPAKNMRAVTHLSVARPDRAFDHKALFYENESGFLEGTVAFIREGLEAHEPALVMVDRTKAERLRDVLGPDSVSVQFADIREVGANPAWMIPAWRKFIERHRDSGGLRGISEPCAEGRSAAELAECQIHESLLNIAFANCGPFALLCPYDTVTLDPGLLDEARHSHPHLTDGVRERPSERYRSDDASLRFAAPLPDPPADAYKLAFDASKLRALRAFVTWHGSAAGLRGHRLDDLVLAANEIATNSIRHGGGSGVLRLWAEAGTVICEARDRGRLEWLLAGREVPHRDQHEGRGLWLTNQLCDLVQIRSCVEGTSVRLHVRAVTAG
jgi:anti-sigma regulatory factor (Ser/Thr protein kinase)